MSSKVNYDINKLVGRPFEYKGLKGAYVYKSIGLIASALFSSMICLTIFKDVMTKIVCITTIILLHILLLVRYKMRSDKFKDLQRNRAKYLVPKVVRYRTRTIFYNPNENSQN